MKKEFISKQDLGVAYFPNIDTVAARQKLCNLIHDDKALFRRLSKMSYRKSCKCLSPI